VSIQQKTHLATWLTMVTHLAAVIGAEIGYAELFMRCTPMNLMLTFWLLWYTAPEKNIRLATFFIICFFTGFGAELIGIHTGILFGSYQYGPILGTKWNGVPLLIGLNWFIVVYASGMLAHFLRHAVGKVFPMAGKAAFTRWVGISLVLDGALLATLFDWIMEPAAVKLCFWQWSGGHIPMVNYLTWFFLSMILLVVFKRMQLRHHPFAINLLLIQALFFLLMRG
jgi:bisanhydrobacterioruberin hydratase